jgi:hypothetical protein
MSFPRRIEFLEPGTNPFLSDTGLSFGKEVIRIDAYIPETPELHLYVNRVLPTAIAHSPYQRFSRKWSGAPLVRRRRPGAANRDCSISFQRLPRKWSAFITAAPERRMAAEWDPLLLQAEQDRLLDGRRLRLRVRYVGPTSAGRPTIRHSRDFDMKAAQHTLSACSSTAAPPLASKPICALPRSTSVPFLQRISPTRWLILGIQRAMSSPTITQRSSKSTARGSIAHTASLVFVSRPSSQMPSQSACLNSSCAMCPTPAQTLRVRDVVVCEASLTLIQNTAPSSASKAWTSVLRRSAWPSTRSRPGATPNSTSSTHSLGS